MPLKISESKIEKKVVAFCKKHGIYCRKFTSPSNRGVPDRVLGKDGKVFFLELKSLGNTPTSLQKHEMKQLADHGMQVAWADSYEDAVTIISAYFNVSVKTPNPKDLI